MDVFLVLLMGTKKLGEALFGAKPCTVCLV